MQRRMASANRCNASRSYRRKLQKRLMHHKQQLEDLEAAKKAFHASTQVGHPVISVCLYSVHMRQEVTNNLQKTGMLSGAMPPLHVCGFLALTRTTVLFVPYVYVCVYKMC
jgi:hypothetical protein